MNDADIQIIETLRGLLSTVVMGGALLGFIYWILRPLTEFAIEFMRTRAAAEGARQPAEKPPIARADYLPPGCGDKP